MRDASNLIRSMEYGAKQGGRHYVGRRALVTAGCVGVHSGSGGTVIEPSGTQARSSVTGSRSWAKVSVRISSHSNQRSWTATSWAGRSTPKLSRREILITVSSTVNRARRVQDDVASCFNYQNRDLTTLSLRTNPFPPSRSSGREHDRQIEQRGFTSVARRL